MTLPVASKIDYDFHGPRGSNASNKHHVTHKGSLLFVANSEKNFRRP
jgi:hypothetical protein